MNFKEYINEMSNISDVEKRKKDIESGKKVGCSLMYNKPKPTSDSARLSKIVKQNKEKERTKYDTKYRADLESKREHAEDNKRDSNRDNK